MTDNIELKPMGRSAPTPPPRHPDTSLHASFKAAEEKARAAVHLQEGNLDTISIWGLAVTAWYVACLETCMYIMLIHRFSALALPLLLFPRIILFFAQSPASPHVSASSRDDHYDTFTPLESFLILILSLGLFTLALASLLILAPAYHPPATNPSRKPLLGLFVGLTTMSALLGFNSTAIGGLGTVIGLGNAVIAGWGWWVVMFGEMKFGEKRSKMPERLKKL
jgi:hypothetical protein